MSSPLRCEHGVMLDMSSVWKPKERHVMPPPDRYHSKRVLGSAVLPGNCSVCQPSILQSTDRVIEWNPRSVTEATAEHLSASKTVRPKLWRKDNAWRGAPATPWVRLNPPTREPVLSPIGRPSGQIILVQPTPSHIPYGIVSTVRKIKGLDCPLSEFQPDYAFGILGNVSPAEGKDDALNAQYTTTSLDKDFRRGGDTRSPERGNDGDDVPRSEPVVLSAEGFQSAKSATRLVVCEKPFYLDTEYLRAEVELRPVSEWVRWFVMFEIAQALMNASRFEANGRDETLAAHLCREWADKEWQYPKHRHFLAPWFADPRPEDIPAKVTRQMQLLTPWQVRSAREWLERNAVI